MSNDYRKKLYSNIILLGGPTHINNFDKWLNISIQKRVNDRLNKFEKIEKDWNLYQRYISKKMLVGLEEVILVVDLILLV